MTDGSHWWAIGVAAPLIIKRKDKRLRALGPCGETQRVCENITMGKRDFPSEDGGMPAPENTFRKLQAKVMQTLAGVAYDQPKE